MSRVKKAVEWVVFSWRVPCLGRFDTVSQRDGSIPITLSASLR
jgi:hypothetical protein